EIKALKESGASKEELAKKVSEFVAEVTDEHKKELAQKYEGACKLVFGVASDWHKTHVQGGLEHHANGRKRRDHHHGHTLADYFSTYLSWLTQDQQEELKKMKEENKTPQEIQDKVFAFFDAAEGETKTKALELMQSGCRELLKSIVGEEKANELKQLKESGASTDDIHAKVKEFITEITDPHKLEIAQKYQGGCKRAFSIQSSRKRRHEHHDDDDTLEGFVQNHLLWLTPKQKEEI
ncbi:hypothetical protein FO519_010624, partial [Halicephalobus sp. NKZ332]